MSASPKSSETSPDLTGTTVGRFVLRARLDSGRGMGEVYRADDTILKRSVAIKRVSPKLRSDEQYRQRFLKEAERASCLSDPHIAGIYDVLEEKDETFLVMEYVDGTTLRPRLQQPFPMEEFFPAAIQCARALGAAHEKDIIHGDIKPENIMLTTAGQIKILDFGVAKRLAPSVDLDATPSITGQLETFSGTPAYMAPEVLLEKGSDKRSDIFSLGIVFYEMLAGRHPFRADSYIATMDRILHESPKPINQINPQIPEQLGRVVARMLAKDPAKRHPAALDLLSELKELEPKDSPTAVLPASLLRKISRRNASVLVLLIVLLLLLTTGRPLYRWIRQRALSPPQYSTEPKLVLIADFQVPPGDEFSDSSVRELLAAAIEQSRLFSAFSRNQIADTLKAMQKPVDTRLDPAISREICRRKNLSAFITGKIVPAGGAYKIAAMAIDPWNNETLAALEEPLPGKQGLLNAVDKLSVKLRRKLGEEKSPAKGNSMPLGDITTSSEEAWELFVKALESRAAGKMDEALSLMKAAVEHDRKFALAYSRLAVIQMAMGADEEALDSSSEAYALRYRVSERESYWIQAAYYRLRLDYESALQALLTMTTLYSKDPFAHMELAEIYAYAGTLAEAIQSLQRAEKLYPENLMLQNSLIAVLAQAGRADEALGKVEVARRMGTDMSSIASGEAFAWWMKDDVRHAQQALQPWLQSSSFRKELGRLCLAKLYIYTGKFDEAARQLESDLEIDIRTGNESYAKDRHYLLSRVYLLMGQKKLALNHLDALLAGTKISPIQLHQLRQAGLVLAEMGEGPSAQRVLKTLEQLQLAFPSNFSKAAVAQLHGSLAQAAGRHADALQDLQQARTLWNGVMVDWSLATYWEERKDYSKALEFYQQVIDRKGDMLQWDFPGFWPLAHLRAARCYYLLGNTKEAAPLYEKFLRLWGTEANELPLVTKVSEELRGLNKR
jgi:serine/threonine protein kinase